MEANGGIEDGADGECAMMEARREVRRELFRILIRLGIVSESEVPQQ
jgi:hypothetical protein